VAQGTRTPERNVTVAMTILARLTTALRDRYQIEREIGQGGMATVYLALDLRHERHVAIKVLHPELSAVIGAERFLSEIKLTASLQHPHILPLFDSGVADELVYYVMPFVEGETLRGKLERERQLPVADSVRIASEIADALQYAHERGVIHRDIKPENVLLQNGHAIVADFGIALAVQQAGGARMTQTGMSLGTPQYMAPEQAMGERTIDARADVYALGAVTYELLAGEPPFSGPTAQSILARVMTERSRPLRTVRDTVPPNVEAAVATALEKLPADRMPTARAFADALHDTSLASGSLRVPGQATRGRSRVSMRTVAALTAAGIAAGALGTWLYMGGVRQPATHDSTELPLRFEVTTPDTLKLRLVCCGQLFAISPNGRYIVYQASPRAATLADSGRADHQLYVRDLTDVSVRALSGTTNAQDLFFSPNGEEIGFAVERQLMRTKLAGGEPQTVTTLPEGYNGGGSWSKDGSIIFVVSRKVVRVSADGGTADLLFASDSADTQVFGPDVVDDSKVLLYATGSVGVKPHVMWRSLTTGKTKIVALGTTPTYLPAARALLLVESDGTLVQYPFDITTGDTTGHSTRIATKLVLRSPVEAFAEYSAAPNGTVVLATRRTGLVTGGMTFVDLHGPTPKVRRLLPTYNDFFPPQFTPDGKKIVVMIPQNDFVLTPLVYDIARGATTLLRAPGIAASTTVSSDGDSVLYLGPSNEIFITAIDGSMEPRRALHIDNWSLAGREMSAWGPWLVAPAVQASSHGLSDIVIVNRDSGTKAVGYVGNPSTIEDFPKISPDGKWLIYASNETGAMNVYVSSFPRPSGRYLVSPNGGDIASWRMDAREILFANGNNIYSVSFTPGGPGAAPSIGVPQLVYKRDPWGAVGISPDGKSLAFVDRVREADPLSLVVRLHAVSGMESRR
jgi:Tol biopolymer transport system component/tRNA A-37 threonylcarbamoyl transferase component Bud32